MMMGLGGNALMMMDPKQRGGRGFGPSGGGGGSSNTYVCNRCLKPGHIMKFCPTKDNAAYDQEIRLMNVPRTGRKKVSSLEGIDTSMCTVIQLSDGSYEFFETSAAGMDKLTKDGYVSYSCCFPCTVLEIEELFDLFRKQFYYKLIINFWNFFYR